MKTWEETVILKAFRKHNPNVSEKKPCFCLWFKLFKLYQNAMQCMNMHTKNAPLTLPIVQ